MEMNNVQLIGRLTKDVDMKYTPNGVAVSTFMLAVNRPFKNKNNEYEADFIRTQVWRKTAENVANYCKKGSQVAVTGRIQTSSFEGQDGNRVFMTEVIADYVQFLDTKNDNQNRRQGNSNHQNQQSNPYQGQPQGNQQQNQNPFGNQAEPLDIDDSDLPF